MCKRIAVIMGKMEYGGVEAVVMNYYRHIDRQKIQFDFIVDNTSSCPQKEEIEKLGGKVFFVPPYQKIFFYMRTLIGIFKENDYAIVHSHINTLSVFPLAAAWFAKIPVRIAHSHSTAGRGEYKKNFLKYSLKPFSKLFATDYFACSEHAGRWLFGNRAYEQGLVKVWKNAIDIDSFLFNEDVRIQVRKEFGIDDKFVIGHVGRFSHEKNHKFLINVFKEVHKKNKNTCLMLVGEGKLFWKIKEQVQRLGLNEAVLFLGARTDVNRLYQAMDIFVLPSHSEGLGLVAIEAQTSGLEVILSTNVPAEAMLSGRGKYCELDIIKWKEELLCVEGKENDRKVERRIIIERGYDIGEAGEKYVRSIADLFEIKRKEYQK